ncbi:FkbM family methyltransferase [Mycolicibacterium sp.]|uniref:FkbM family methyltransferase n=1 Tax=Mycolicibacterium sp. TaxID=2320850 RepID=UPI0037C562E2
MTLTRYAHRFNGIFGGKINMASVKQLLKKTPWYEPARRMYWKAKGRPRHPLQDMPTTAGPDLVHLGTEYGGWAFLDSGNLNGCTIVSAGLGEDASFDVEFAAKYGATVIIVDPTPRAIQHFEHIVSRLGHKNSCAYSPGGQQPVEAYDLSTLDQKNFVLVNKALWNENAKLKFFEPSNPKHVSHSIINYQNEYSENTSYIEVQAVTLSELLIELSIDPKNIPLIKLDIEGAEIEVLTQCISDGIKPEQILVEFDELNVPSLRGFERVSQIHELLSQSGYEMMRTDGAADFLYVKNQ